MLWILSFSIPLQYYITVRVINASLSLLTFLLQWPFITCMLSGQLPLLFPSYYLNFPPTSYPLVLFVLFSCLLFCSRNACVQPTSLVQSPWNILASLISSAKAFNTLLTYLTQLIDMSLINDNPYPLFFFVLNFIA